VTLPVVWTPEAAADLKEAQAWYGNIRHELGERFALAVEATVEAIAERPCNFPSFTADDGARECGVFLTEYSLSCKRIGLWSSPASMADAIRSAGRHVSHKVDAEVVRNPGDRIGVDSQGW
jgi:hypothetical protein